MPQYLFYQNRILHLGLDSRSRSISSDTTLLRDRKEMHDELTLELDRSITLIVKDRELSIKPPLNNLRKKMEVAWCETSVPRVYLKCISAMQEI